MSPDGVRSSGGARRREWPASWWRATDKQRSRHKRQSIPSIPGLRRQATRKLFYPDTSRPKLPKEKEAKRKRPVEKWIPKRPHFPTGPTTTTTGTNPSFAHASQRTRHQGRKGRPLILGALCALMVKALTARSNFELRTSDFELSSSLISC